MEKLIYRRRRPGSPRILQPPAKGASLAPCPWRARLRDTSLDYFPSALKTQAPWPQLSISPNCSWSFFPCSVCCLLLKQ